MKTFSLAILGFILSAGIALSQDFPTDGNWKLQIIGVSDDISVEINGTTWILELNDNEISQIVTIDNDKKTVTIPLFTDLADYYFFEMNNGYIELKAGGKFNIPVLDNIQGEMTNLRGINDVTDDFVEKLIMEIEFALYRVPIMRLSRN